MKAGGSVVLNIHLEKILSVPNHHEPLSPLPVSPGPGNPRRGGQHNGVVHTSYQRERQRAKDKGERRFRRRLLEVLMFAVRRREHVIIAPHT